jgi:hypothetical protein
MLAAVASLGLLLASGETILWNASAETQARGRNEPGGAVAGRLGIGELDLHARLGLSTQGADGAAALTYLPSLLVSQVAFGVAGEAGNATRHGGRLELQTRLTPTTRLTSRTSLDWGLTDFSPLSGQATPPVVGLLPARRFVRTLGVEAMLDLTHVFSRRLQLSVAAGLQRSGGVGHDAVSVLPFQVGPQATASLSWAADRTNAITLLASASESRFSSGTLVTSASESQSSSGVTSVFSSLEMGWTRRASPHTVLDAAAGLVLVRSSGPDFFSRGTYGSGALGASWDLRMAPQRALRTSLRLRLVPGVDRFTALAILAARAEGNAELTEGRLRLGVSAAEGHIISGAAVGADDLRLETRSSWTVSHGWALEARMGAARTNQLLFTGWQFQAAVGLAWADRGSF